MKFLSLFVFVIIISSCSSQHIDSTVGPFEESRQAYAQSWTGGIPGSGSGINLFMPRLDIKFENIDMVYFQEMMTDRIEFTNKASNDIVARFKIDFNNKPDINMSLDPKKEYGNKPHKTEKFPFDLEDDEMVVKFTRNGRTYYTKFLGIQARPAMDLPSRPQ